MSPMTYDDDQDELGGYGQPQYLPQFQPQAPEPRQSLLPPEYSASDDLTWARLRAGRSSIEDDVRKGVLAEDLGQDLLQQVDGMLLPLRQKKEAARQYGKQQAVQQIMEDQGLQRGIQHVNDLHRSQQFPDTITAFTDLTRPFGYQTAYFRPDGKGGFAQVEFPEPPEKPAAEEFPEASPPEKGTEGTPYADALASADPASRPEGVVAPPEPATTPRAQSPTLSESRPRPFSAHPAEIRSGQAQTLAGASLEDARYGLPAGTSANLRAQTESRRQDLEERWQELQRQTAPAGEFTPTSAQRAMSEAFSKRGGGDMETYRRAVLDTKAQEQGVSRDYSITQADTVALWHQAERSTGGRAGPQRNRAVETLHRQLVGMKKDQLNDLRDAELRSNQKREIMALQSAENQRKEGARSDAAKELLEERQAFTKEGLQGLKPASIITLATNVESGMRAEKRQAIQAGLGQQEMEPWMTNPALEEVEATRRLQALAKRVYGMLGAKGEDFAPLAPAQREALDQEERQKGPGPWKAGYKVTDERRAAPPPSVRAPVAGGPAKPLPRILDAQKQHLEALQRPRK